MKLLLRLSVAAALLLAGTFAESPAQAKGALQSFLNDPQVQATAPHLVDQILAQGRSEDFAGFDINAVLDAATGQLLPAVKIPLLNDIVDMVTMVAFNSKQADWNRIEQAKLKAIKDNGQEAVDAIQDLSSLDAHRALIIVNTIYDAVIHLPTMNKANYASLESNRKEGGSSMWDVLGFGIIKSSDAVRNVRNAITPSGRCETTDSSYLRGVEELVYYTSLTDGVAGGTLSATPPTADSKNIGLFRLTSAVAKLAIEIHMAQGVAKLADLDPKEDRVRAMIYLSLTAESPLSTQSQMAREINNMIVRKLADKIPDSALRSVEQQAALVLITKGAGRGERGGFLSSVPVLKNIFAFSSDVIDANNVGDVLKYVFCPIPASALETTTESAPAKPAIQKQQNQKSVADDADLADGDDGAAAAQESDQQEQQQRQAQQHVLQRPDSKKEL
ncbi:hypothetical protein BGZ94_004231 [Podila epigama]|nr:hypothetical protein BGZ94_004231 [Podila epigama]